MCPRMSACCWWLLLAAVPALCENIIYKKIGDEVVLEPGSVSEPIKSLTWKVDVNLAMMWDGKEVDSFRQFKERGSLNTTTGQMTITGLTPSDSGTYTAESKEIKNEPVRLIVISAVPVPSVNLSCNDEKTSCTLTCDGNTTDAGEVKYAWKSDDSIIANLLDKTHHITKDSSNGTETFSCEMKNPVSEESSMPFPNPLFTNEPKTKEGVFHPKTIAGLIVFFSLLVSVLLLAAVHRCKTGMWFYQKESMPWEADFWRKKERKPKNTAAHQEKKQTEEETSLT
ncbi:uncharacterized protein LOC113163990 [Anabas testudineus]|uniref:Immunoglobulin domain-containing protein n=1 Tax=Anabas testudineus TaxID=64144 RepID=A0A3Q1J1C1_ANATE|nr:uncharacterized protein LOC113163990 [Anabas testudineus]XP_026218848.1 uncharacterized protein LOC113163990 [Anabas testudineus]XP_026218849.1 uncharacterized protein LOC113163990 [Anabas testudineus]